MDNWREHAACRHEDPDLFFPVGTTGPALLQARQAKTVCGRCPVRDQCLDWALDTGQTLGIWGGTTEGERRALKRRASSRRRSG
jgi:WhiB family redox-sensing transcriptional regulator